MRLRVSDAISVAARETNEDGWLELDRQIWLLDGASGLMDRPITSGPTDAAWLVERALTIISRDRSEDLIAALASVVEQVERELALTSSAHAHELPSASLAAVQLTGGTLEVLTLGDCRLVIRRPHQRASSVDAADVLDRLDGTAIQSLVEEQQREDMDLDTARAAIAELLRSNRNRLNTPGGYQALAPGLDVSVLSTTMLEVTPGTVGLLVSDGFFRLVDTFHRFDLDGLIDAVQSSGTTALIKMLRAIEASDPRAREFPRLKLSDDATAVAFEIVVD
jgi:serine/threonine protein phosphatase PrpC